MKKRTFNNTVKTTIPVLVIGLFMFVSGCDNTIEPYEDEQTHFSIYGYLDLTETSHYIRVKDVSRPLLADSTRGFDANVIFENLETGESQQLESEVLKEDGMYLYNYYVEKELSQETTYRVLVEDLDGRKSSATATTPAEIDVSTEPVGRNCTTDVVTLLPNVNDSTQVDFFVGFEYNHERKWIRTIVHTDENENGYVEFAPQMILNLAFIEDFEPGDTVWGEPPVQCSDLDNNRFWIRYTHYGPDWAGYERPVSPLEAMDVKNGLGFFGAFQQELHSIPVDTMEIF